MPYDNAYNRMIANDIMKLNKKYLENEKLTGQGMSGGFLGALAGMILPSVVSAVANKVFGSGMSGGLGDGGNDCECEGDVAECVCGDAKQYGEGVSGAGMKKKRGRKPKMAGGALGADGGFASGTFMDTGYDRTIGAGMSAGVKKYAKKKSNMGCAGGAKKLLNAKQKIEGKGLVGDLVGSVGSIFGLAKPKRGRKPKKMTGGTELGLPPSIAGSGKKKGRKSKASSLEGEGLLSGIGGIVDDLFGFGSSGGVQKKRGRKSKMAGGANLTPVANMKASYMTGQGRSGAGSSGGKRINKRAELVKKIMKEQGLSMIEASKYVSAHKLYKK